MEYGNLIPNQKFNCWVHDKNTYELYRKRCRKEIEEMTCAAQAAEILGPLTSEGENLLDAGCCGGYYYWSFADRGYKLDYHGLDFSAKLIELAKTELAPFAGINPANFRTGRIEDLDKSFDNIICFNVLTNSPHYAEALERLLLSTGKRLLIRESMSDTLTIRYTPDNYLDTDFRHLRVYHNTYPLDEVVSFIEEHGFTVTRFKDRRTNDKMEMVVDIPHYWKILLAERNI